jgi:hypothetical protein
MSTTANGQLHAADLARLVHARQAGEWYQTRCPSHDDQRASLSFKDGSRGDIIFRCHAGCDWRAVREALERQHGVTLHGNGQQRESSTTRPAPQRDPEGFRQRLEAAASDFAVVPHIYPGPAAETNSPITFRSAAEVAKASGEQVPFLWRGYVAEGNVTVLGAREKAGKSTLAYALVRALLDGDPFLGQATAKTGVVLLSEEADATVADKLRRFDLVGEEGRFSIVTRSAVRGRPDLATVVAAAVAEARRIGAKLLVVDTLSYWGQLPGDDENHAGAAQAVMRPLLDAAGQGLGVLVLHHVAKASGELRGSTAIAASADIIVALHRENEAPNRRRLEAVGRYAETPGSVLVELQGDDYVLLGTPSEVSAEQVEAAVLQALPTEGDGLTIDEVVQRTGAERRRVGEALGRLLQREAVQRSGAGKRGSPYRFCRNSILPLTKSIDAAQTAYSGGGATTNGVAHRDAAEDPWADIAVCAGCGRFISYGEETCEACR